MAAPTVSYTWMTIDEVSGHSWITLEKAYRFEDPEREKKLDEALSAKLHKDSEAVKSKDGMRHCCYILKTQLRERQNKISVIATARLYRRKGINEAN